jgi:uncharacterized protein (TIGR03086 family)
MRMLTIPDLRSADATAVRATMTVVSRVRAEDLDRPTPCAEWNLAALLAHMTAQPDGFAAAADGHGESPDEWRVRPLGEDPSTEYARASERVIAAFAPETVLTSAFALPEFGDGVQVPGRQAISFHFVDYVVHGWDVARSLGLPYDLPAGLVELAVPVAEAVPGGDRRLVPGAAFAPERSVPDGSGPFARVLALLGRSPSWPEG